MSTPQDRIFGNFEERKAEIFGPQFQAEWAEYLRMRSDMVDQIIARTSVPLEVQQAMASSGYSPEQQQFGANLAQQNLWDQVWPNHLAQEQARIQGLDHDDLAGRARFYGIDPEGIPHDVLAQILLDKRAEAQEGAERVDLFGSLGGLSLTGAKTVGLGVGEAAIRLATQLPFAGNAIAQTNVARAARRKLSELNEGLISTIPTEQETEWKIMKGAGMLTSYVFPARIAYTIAGAAGGAIGMPALTRVAPALARSSAFTTFNRGAFATALLEGGGAEPILPTYQMMSRAANGDWRAMMEIGLGTEAGIMALGGFADIAVELGLPKLLGKIQRDMPSRTTSRGNLITSGSEPPQVRNLRTGHPDDADIIDAEFEILGQTGPNSGPPPPGPPGPPVGPGLPRGPVVTPPPAGSGGASQVWYHGSVGTPGASGDIHLGTRAAASQRLDNILGDIYQSGGAQRGQIHPFTVDPNARLYGTPDNPLLGDINPEVGVFGDAATEAAFNQARSQGYQGVYYRNAVEDPGSSSLYLFDPALAQPAGQSSAYPNAGLLNTSRGNAMQAELDMLRREAAFANNQRNLAMRQANMDELTGLGNVRDLRAALVAAEADPSLAIVAFDARRFKAVNDNLGHAAGDQALIHFANALNSAADQLGIARRNFRPGGDEFASIVPAEQAAAFQELAQQLSRQTPSEGISTYLDGAVGQTLQEADDILMAGKRVSRADQLTVGEASQEAATLSNHATIMESPAVTEMLTKSRIDIEDVVHSALQTAPEAIHVMRGVGDAGRIMQRLVAATESIQGVIRHADRPDFEALVVREVDGSFMVELRQIDEAGNLTNVFANYNAIDVDSVREILKDNNFALPPARILPQDLRVVQRTMPDGSTRQDLLISNGLTITNKRAAQYRDHGVFDGMEVKVNGSAGFLRQVGPETSVFENAAGQVLEVPTHAVTPTNRSWPTEELFDGDLEVLNAEFRRFVDEAMAQEAGLPSAAAADQQFGYFSTETSSQLPRLLDEFTFQHFTDLRSRIAFEAYVNTRRGQQLVSELADPSDVALMQQVGREINSPELLVRRLAGEPEVPLVDLATQKGFKYVPNPARPTRYRAKITHSETTSFAGGTYHSATIDYVDTSTGVRGFAETTYLPNGNLEIEWTSAEGGAGGIGGRGVREIGRQVVEEFANRGLPINEIYGVRLSGARATNPTYVPERNLAQAEFRVSADRLLRGRDQVGGTLVDELSDLKVPVESEEAARQFLMEFQRELPDVTPVTDVPFETAQGLEIENPGLRSEGSYPIDEGPVRAMANEVDRLARDSERIMDEAAGLAAEIEASLDAEIATTGGAAGGSRPPTVPPQYLRDTFLPPGGAGGGTPPPPPPPPGAAGGAFGEPNRPPRVSSLHAREEVGRRGIGYSWQRVQNADPVAMAQLMDEFDSTWTQLMQPFRHLMIKIQNRLQELGVLEARPYDDYEAVSRARQQVKYESAPFNQDLSNIVSRFGRKKVRDGTVTKIESLHNRAQRVEAMKAAGYSDREVIVQDSGLIKELVDRLFDRPGVGREVFDYLEGVRRRYLAGMDDPFRDIDGALSWSNDLQGFEEIARRVIPNPDRIDIGDLGVHLIRFRMFNKHMREPYTKALNAWSDTRIDPRMREVMQNWLEVMRYGRDPRQDIVLRGLRHFISKFVPVTDTEVSGMFNTLLTTSYRAALGWRPDVIARDAIQPFLTGARVGFDPIVQAYTQYLKGGRAGRMEMMERALQGGWIEQNMVQVANADAFSRPVTFAGGLSGATPSGQARREFIARIGDFVTDATPRSLREGIQGTKYDPLMPYMKLGELNRLISGEAGYQLAKKALDRFTRGEIDMATLMGESKARVFPKPIQDHFRRAIAAGNYEDAAYVIANEAANFQFRYGMHENPIGLRSTIGRVGMQFGTFTQQYIAYMTEALTQGTLRDKAGFAARYAAVAGSLGALTYYTGWKFTKWMWHGALTFVGGPAVGMVGTGIEAASGIAAGVSGRDPSARETLAMRQFAPERLVPNLLNVVNPYAGGIRTAQSYLGGVSNAEDFTRFTLTGEAGPGARFRRAYRQEYQLNPNNERFSSPGVGWESRPEWGTTGFTPQGQQAMPQQPQSWEAVATQMLQQGMGPAEIEERLDVMFPGWDQSQGPMLDFRGQPITGGAGGGAR